MTAPHPALALLDRAELVAYRGRVTGIGQSGVGAAGPLCAVGEFCTISAESGDDVLAQVVAVSAAEVRLLPLSSAERIRVGARVERAAALSGFPTGDGFAGRAIDAFGRPFDGGPPVVAAATPPSARPEMLDRTVTGERAVTGIRAIDGLVPVAVGQRIGIFAASGVGKTTLVEQMSARIDCDHCILCLIGERGREVERLWRLHRAGGRGAQTTLVAATSDENATARVRALDQALALAEYWRAQGRHVALFVDSVTRLAMALREIGLAAGEPPSLRAYTPNVFASLPRYVERCGADRRAGQITAIFTVLAETDEVDDPIVETMKSLLDGHLVLSRKLADRGHYPPIDVGASVSRVADQVLSREVLRDAQAIRGHVAAFNEARPMIESGIYRAQSNPAIDRAIALQPDLAAFLCQPADEASPLHVTDAAMRRLAGTTA